VDRCDECGLVYGDLPTDNVPHTLRSLGPHYRERLIGASADELRAHPVEGQWSALEYACHVRDVLSVMRDRLQLALDEDHPEWPRLGMWQWVELRSYNDDEPGDVADAIAAEAATTAAAFERLDDAQWERTGTYHWPVTADRTVAWLARHTVHEGEHHLGDVVCILAAARQARKP
jgi:uncharacterized damage-inducible protein DinB